MSKPVCLQSFLRTLRTTKKGLHRHNLSPLLCRETLDLISDSSHSSSSSITPFFSELDLSSLHKILSDHYIPSSICINLFKFLLRNPPSLSFEPDLLSHLILICRALKATNFSEAEKLMKSVAVDQMSNYPFPLIADTVQSCPVNKPRTVAKFFNLMLQVYSGNRLFGEALMVFDHMKANGVQINEKTCTMHLWALKGCDEVIMCVEFLDRMLESGVRVSVYSLTVAVDGLCRNGEVKMGRELVEEMLRRRAVRPNIVTFNVLIAACAKRWNFEELESVLQLMAKEDIRFNLQTYRFLIDGFTSAGKVAEAERLLVEMCDKGLRVDAHLYNLIIKGYGICGAMESAVSLFDEMTERGVAKNPDTYWALINGFSRVGEMEMVKRYMSEMQMKGVQLDKVGEIPFHRTGMVNAVTGDGPPSSDGIK